MKFSIIITICGFQNGIKNDSTKWFTLEIRKSVVSTCIYIPGGGGGSYPPLRININLSVKHTCLILATISQQLNTILRLRENLW